MVLEKLSNKELPFNHYQFMTELKKVSCRKAEKAFARHVEPKAKCSKLEATSSHPEVKSILVIKGEEKHIVVRSAQSMNGPLENEEVLLQVRCPRNPL